ncbi:MAG: 3-dehydroquinate synthase [Leptospirales bacterium]
MTFHETIVRSQAGNYGIRIADGLRQFVPEFLQEMSGGSSRIGLISNPTVRGFHGIPLEELLKKQGFSVVSFDFRDGEVFKTIPSILDCLDTFLKEKWERRDPFLLLGGGVVGDMGAFAASILLRGVPVFHVPTTVVSQVDSSIGGKTGVDHVEGKNLIGSFYPPKGVWIDPGFLETLSLRERRSGLGEVIKYAMIGDSSLLEFLDRELDRLSALSFDRELWEMAIRFSVQDKARIVSEDERETGVRMNLNLGHTFGHALEAAMGYSGILHGEAVGLGILCATRVGERLGVTEKGTEKIISDLLKRAGLPFEWPKQITFPKIAPFLRNDKKSRLGKVTLILPVALGQVIRTSDYDETLLAVGVPD